MSRRVRELDRGGGGRLGRDGECCSAAEGRRDDMLAGEARQCSPSAVYAERFHSLCKRGAGLWLRDRMQTRRLVLLGPIRLPRY